jgi:chromosome segregation ATPase
MNEVDLLREKIRDLETQLRERTGALYELQRQYSSEHFELAESMRNLKIERMRNAGAYAAQDVILERYHRVQARVEELKRRLRQYEEVEDLDEDAAPIVGRD